jgi:hypothetical protein
VVRGEQAMRHERGGGGWMFGLLPHCRPLPPPLLSECYTQSINYYGKSLNWVDEGGGRVGEEWGWRRAARGWGRGGGGWWWVGRGGGFQGQKFEANVFLINDSPLLVRPGPVLPVLL